MEMAGKVAINAAHQAALAADKALVAAQEAAKAAAHQAAKAAAHASRTIGLVSVNKFDLVLWKRFVGLAKMQGKSIPQAMDEAVRMWMRENVKTLDL
jgi:hypothetical protein